MRSDASVKKWFFVCQPCDTYWPSGVERHPQQPPGFQPTPLSRPPLPSSKSRPVIITGRGMNALFSWARSAGQWRVPKHFRQCQHNDMHMLFNQESLTTPSRSCKRVASEAHWAQDLRSSSPVVRSGCWHTTCFSMERLRRNEGLEPRHRGRTSLLPQERWLAVYPSQARLHLLPAVTRCKS